MKLMKEEEDNRTRKIFRSAWPFLVSFLIFLLVKMAVRNPWLVEKYYSAGIYPVIATVFSVISNLIPFSLWDLTWITLLLIVIAGITLVITGRKKLKAFLWQVLRLSLLCYSLFYVCWGFNYFRPGIEARLKWKGGHPDKDAFRSAITLLIDSTNQNYTRFSSDLRSYDRLIEQSYRKNRALLGIDYPNGSRRPKEMLLSSYFAESGVSGYFGPFFNEVHLNDFLLPVDYPFTLAHEKAHQFGIANEAEANITAFLVLSGSGNKQLRYSGYLSLLIYFLDETDSKDFDRYGRLISKEVMDDIRYRTTYYDHLQNRFMGKIQSRMNDAYLKYHHIKDGINNYDDVVKLMISWFNSPGSSRSL